MKQRKTWGGKGRQGETRRDKTSERRARHPTHAHMWGDNGRQWETMGDNGRQWETMGDNGRQWETMGDNESNGRHWETMEDKGRQEFAKADTPSNTGTHMRGDNGETRAREGEHTFQHRHTCVGRQQETRGDKTLGRRTHHPTEAQLCGETLGDKGRQDLGKVDAASNTGTHVGRQWETSGDKTLGRRTLHPTRAHMREDNGRQKKTRGDKTWRTRTHYPTQAGGAGRGVWGWVGVGG